MDRTEQFIDWWRSTSGLFISIEQVLPHIVLHKVPDASDQAPTPLLMGPASLQATVIGSHDPEIYREHLVQKWDAFSANVVKQQRVVADKGEPDLAVGRFAESEVGQQFDYSRLLLPVRTSTGQRLLVAYTTQVNVS